MKVTLLTGKIYDIKEALGFDIIVKKSDRAKRLTLRICSKTRAPVLTMPKNCTNKAAVEFVKKNEVWIENTLLKTPEIKKFQNGDKIFLFGQALTITHDSKLKSGTFIKDGNLFVSGEEAFLHRRVKDFIKKEAKTRLTQLTREKAAIIGARLNSVTIKDTKSRWGSCSTHKNINYSWRLSLAPLEVIDYIVSHEVAHLKHLDHSENFWACVKSLCPNYAKNKSWLQKYGKLLHVYE
jgi:hypothetical protein